MALQRPEWLKPAADSVVADNIKLGPGGIREAEFIAQVFQLIRGGREKSLQVRSTREAYRRLAELKLLEQDAVDELVNTVYASLQTAGPDDPTLETVSTFLRNGGSLETTAKELSVHPNTVRYRLKRAAETTGWDAADAREAYVLRTAIALGRMHTA